MQRSALYTILFATAVCIVCAIVVSSAAVSLKPAQEINAALEKQRNVLLAAGLLEAGEKIDAVEVQRRFENIRMVVVNLETGEEATDIDPATFDQVRAAKDPETSSVAPKNRALVQRLPDHVLVYEVLGDNGVEGIVLPIQGYGLWSTLYGFIALDNDLETIRGITFYQHGETPGLGGEVDNPKWKARWVGRKAFGEDGQPKITVIKGPAGPPAEDPYEVDGLSGATLTARGVTNLVHFWLGDEVLGPYLENLSRRRAT
ncbi:MAG: Na(+)-translocating NADH-quinone reductase subunit C [Nitrospirae bacterium]|nr:Na(+)-translocating NADH-quinone reductase subunit C [Nitrospirota bacterium]